MASWLRDLLGLLLPVECAGCGRDDVAWCPRCAGRLDGVPWRCENRAPRLDRMDGCGPLPVWTLADCTGDVRRAIIAWKDRGRADLGPHFARAIAGQARYVAAELASVAPLAVVPAPSTAASRRRRGGNLVDTLASGVVAGLGDAGVRSEMAPVLRRARGDDQVGLGARDRARNLAGRLSGPRRPRSRGRRSCRGARRRRPDHRSDARRVAERRRAGRRHRRRGPDARLHSPSRARSAPAAAPAVRPSDAPG